MTLEIHHMRKHEGQARPIDSEQFQRVIDDIRKKSTAPYRDVAILQMSYRAGLRAKEIAALKLSDILDGKGDIKRSITLRRIATKGGKGGVAYMSHAELREALEVYIVLNRSKIPTEYENVFISRKGTPFSPSSMSRLFTHIYTRAGFDGCTSHTGRRSLCKNLNAQNVSVYNIQKIMRHSNIQTTINHYLSVDEETLATLVEEV